MVGEDKPAEVFILECLTERDKRFTRGKSEGEWVETFLAIHGKTPRIHPVGSIPDLMQALVEFESSGYKYLHISAHGNQEQIFLGDVVVEYEEFADILGGKLDRKRLFVSACELGNDRFISEIERTNPRILSIMAPTDTIQVKDALSIWTIFYPAMFHHDSVKMTSGNIKYVLDSLCRLFTISFMFSWRRKRHPRLVCEIFESSKSPAD